jgi:mono/diheme cytochrome c family protein
MAEALLVLLLAVGVAGLVCTPVIGTILFVAKRQAKLRRASSHNGRGARVVIIRRTKMLGCRMLLPLLALSAAIGNLAMAADADVGSAARGRALAEAVCASCHAIGREGESPLAAAPTFRSFRQRFVFDWLQQAFEDGIGRGHAGQFMPDIMLSRYQTDDLIAYLDTLTDESGGQQRIDELPDLDQSRREASP